jgi:hypothetical protein
VNVADLVATALAGDEALCVWVMERLRPLAMQPKALRLTVHVGGGKISVRRDAPVVERPAQ